MDEKLVATRRYNQIVFVIALLALIAAASLALMHRGDTARDLRGDSPDYHRIAVHLISSHTYGSTYRPPAYPAFVALVYLVAGERPVAVYLVQALLFALSLVFVFKTAVFITKSERTAAASMILCALWIPFYQAVPEILTETFAGFVIVITVWSALIAVHRPTILSCTATGVLLAITVLTKPSVLPFAVIPPLFIAFEGLSRRRRLAMGAITLLATLVILAPWTLRNRIVTGENIPISTGGGLNFWMGNWPYYDLHGWGKYGACSTSPRSDRPGNGRLVDYASIDYTIGCPFPPELTARLRNHSVPQQDRILMNEGVSYIKQDPLQATGIFLRKFSALWLGSFGTRTSAIRERVPHIGRFAIPKMCAIQIPLSLAAVAGWLVLPSKARRRARIILALLLIWTLAYVAFVSTGRYAIPVDYYRILFASCFVQWLLAKLGWNDGTGSLHDDPATVNA